MSFEEQIMFKDKYTSTFSRRIEANMFLNQSNILQRVKKNVLRTARCFLRGMYSYGCSLVLLYEQTNISHFM